MTSPRTDGADERAGRSVPGERSSPGERLRVFFSQSWVCFLGLYGWLTPQVYVTAKVITPIFQVIFFATVARYALKLSDVSFYVIGNALIACHTSAIFGMGVALRNERAFGTLQLLMAAPTSRFFICAGRSLFYILDGLFTALVALAAGSLTFGLGFDGANLGGFFACALAGAITATCFGLFLGGFGLKVHDVNLILNLAMYSLLVLSGANFPIEELPGPVAAVSWALPLTRAIRGARLAYNGAPWATLAPLAGGELAVGAVYLAAGYLLFSWMELRARRDGAFEFY